MGHFLIYRQTTRLGNTMKKLLLLICIGAMLFFVACYRQGTDQKSRVEPIGTTK